MYGKRIQDYWSQKIEAMLAICKQFETLWSEKEESGSSEHPENGRYVGDLLK